MAEPGAGLEIPITATGGDAAAREIAKPTESLQRYIMKAREANRVDQERAAAQQMLSQQFTASANASGQLAQGFSGLATNSSKLAGALSLLSQEAGAAGGAFGKVANSLGGMLSMVGGGVTLGTAAATGGAIVAIGLMGKAIADMVKESDAATKVLDEQTAASDRLASASRNVAMVKATNTQRVFLLQQEAVAREQEQERWDAARLAAGRLAAMNAIAKREDMETAAGARGFGNASSAANDNAREQEQLDRFLDAARGRDLGIDAETAADPEEWDRSLSITGGIGQFKSGGPSIGSGKSTGMLSKNDEMIRQAKSVKDAWADAGAAMTDGMAGVFSALITGGADAAKAMLANMGDQMVAGGMQKSFAGAFQTLLGNPMGPTMIAIGAAEMAFGAGLGAAMGGAAAPGGGAARPSPGAAQPSQSSQPSATVINLYSLNPTAEAGRNIKRSVQMADRKRNR